MDVNPIKLMDLARLASEQFLQDGVSLNKAISKLAEAHELNPFQIERVAEIANHEVNLILLKKSADKNFTFDLADPKIITTSIKAGPLDKLASVSADDLLSAFDRTMDVPEMPVFEPNPDNQAQLDRGIGVILEKLAAKADAFRHELESRRFNLFGEIENVVGQITKVAKDHILLDKGKLSDLLKYACIKDPEAAGVYQQLFKEIKEDLMKLGAPVDRAIICDDLEMPGNTLEVINGGHILSVLLDTFKRKISDEDNASQRLRLMDTFGNAVVDQIKTIKTPDDVSRDLFESLDALDKKAEAASADEFTDFLAKEAIKIPAAKIGLLLAALGAAGLAGSTVKHGVKGAIKEIAEPYDEREQLSRRARANY